METFQKTVIIVATIVLIICLFFVLLFLKKSLENAVWPPIKSKCPDYWDVELNSNETEERCKNNSNINTCSTNYPANLEPPRDGYCSGSIADPGLDPDIFTTLARGSTRPDDLNCAKYRWAKSERITWDGITNNKNVCKNATI